MLLLLLLLCSVVCDLILLEKLASGLGLGSWEAAKLPMHENLLSSAPCLSLERAVACVEIAMVIHSQSIGHTTACNVGFE